MRKCLAAATALATIFVVPAASSATVLNAAQILNQFNVTTINDLKSSQDIEGRALAGHDLIANGAMQVNSKGGTPPSQFDDLVVGNDVLGGTVNLNNTGNASVGNNVSNSVFELNGGGVLRSGGSITATANQGTKIPNLAGTPGFADRFPEDVENQLKNASASASGLSGSAPTVSGSRATFNAAPNSKGLSVYSFDFSLLDSVNEIDLQLNGAKNIIMNVTGLGGDLNDNFLAAPFAAAPKTLWNFSEATQLNFQNQFFGSVLAPFATATNITPIEGSLAVYMADLNGEVHLQPYVGPVPLPAGLPLALTGVAAFAWLRRRRSAA